MFRSKRPLINKMTKDIDVATGKFINLFDIYTIYVAVLFIYLLFCIISFGINYNLIMLFYIFDIFCELNKL